MTGQKNTLQHKPKTEIHILQHLFNYCESGCYQDVDIIAYYFFHSA